MTMPDMPDARAHGCGGTLRLNSEDGTFRIHDTDVPVKQLFWRCDTCSEELVTEELAQAVEQEAASLYRKRERRLTGGEIRQIRERLGLTQDLLERALGLGPKTIVRWEAERVMPNRSMDNLLRIIDRDCGALLYLAGLHEVDLPDACFAKAKQTVDGRGWPSVLVARLTAAAEQQETDVNSYLIMVLTEHLTVIERAEPPAPEATYRGLYGATIPEEGWLRDYNAVMRQDPNSNCAA